jgi:hypothetical protein
MLPPIKRSTACLHILGDELVPEKISELLGCMPTYSVAKGGVVVAQDTGRRHLARTGRWSLKAPDPDPRNLDKQIDEILGQLKGDVDIWQALGSRYDISMFCGIFMIDSHESVNISPSCLAELGKRGMKLTFDIYGPEK